MSFDKDIRAPGLGGINIDIIDSKLSINDTRYVRNGRRFNGNDGRDGTVRNIKGTTKVTYQGDDYGYGAEVIGTCNDYENNGVIIFIYAPNPYYRDTIVEWYPDIKGKNEISKMKCGNCEVEFNLEWDYSNKDSVNN